MDMKLSHRVDIFADIITDCIGTNQREEIIDLERSMLQVMTYLRQIKRDKRTLYIVGNGGSAAVASHALVDFVNVAKIDARVLHESSLITCMANDFGYQNAYARVLAQCLKPEDVLIAISSSGCSLNICQAAQVAKDYGAYVVTLTGFRRDNTLRQLGDINFWLDSSDYGFVEVGHQFILHNLSDRFGVEAQKKEAVNMQEDTLDA
jgi:D-sedoheptulose 7-phosphate isomerase